MRALRRTYPGPRTALTYDTCFQLLIAKVTPKLFERYPTAEALASAKPSEIERVIRPTGFFRQKTKSIIGSARTLVEEFGGELPRTVEALTTLPGVARKTANVVLANCWPRPQSNHGIFVDTHIRRISQRLALTPHEDPVKIEQDLMNLLPSRAWVDVPHALILLGRGPCKARNPDHESCPLLKWCPTGLQVLGLSRAPARRASRAPAKKVRRPR
jgi:endonuclease III